MNDAERRLSELETLKKTSEIEIEMIEQYKATLKLESAEIFFWAKSGIWQVKNGPYPKPTGQGLEEALLYLRSPDTYDFSKDAIPYVKKSKDELMAEALQLIMKLNVEHKILDSYAIRILLSEEKYIDYWPTTRKWSLNSGTTQVCVSSMKRYIRNSIAHT